MEHLAEYFKVFSEPNRLAVLEALRDGPLNVTAVVEKTGLVRPWCRSTSSCSPLPA